MIVTLHGGSTEQITLPTTLDGLAAAGEVGRAPAADPVHVIMGAAAEQRHELSWYETKPLFGWRVLVPRTKDQAAPDGRPAADLRRAQRGGADHLGRAAAQPAADGQGDPRVWSRAATSGWPSPRSTRSRRSGRSSRSTGWTPAPSPGSRWPRSAR